MAGRRISYAWARKVPESASGGGQGLAWARLLAANALEWREQAPRRGPRPYPLSAEELARELGLPLAVVRERIADARYAFFGSLSDSGIYAKLARERERGEEGAPPTCKAPDCEKELPERRSVRREYCHSSCRRRHYYQRLHPGARPAPHLRGERKQKAAPIPLDLERALAFVLEHAENPRRALRRAKQGKYRAPASDDRA